MKVEVYPDAAGEWRFRIKARNGEILASSEGYKNRADCLGTVHSLQQQLRAAEVVIRGAKEPK